MVFKFRNWFPDHWVNQLKDLMRAHTVNCGVPGQADLNGILKIKMDKCEPRYERRISVTVGVRICVEIKSGNSRQSQKQKNFCDMIESMGGIYVVARTPEQTIQEIKAKAEQKFGPGCLGCEGL